MPAGDSTEYTSFGGVLQSAKREDTQRQHSQQKNIPIRVVDLCKQLENMFVHIREPTFLYDGRMLRNNFLFVKLFFVLFVLTALFPVFAEQVDENQACLTLTFDDGSACQYTVAQPLLEKYGIKATFYLTTSCLDLPGYLTAEQVILLASRGHEIASHGVTHRPLTQLSRQEIEQELVESRLFLEQLTGASVDSFAPPFGFSNPIIRSCTKKSYRSSRTITRGFNTLEWLDPFAMLAYVVFRTTSDEEIKKWIEYAIEKKRWVILVYHRMHDTGETVSIDALAFEKHLQIIRNSGISTATVKDLCTAKKTSLLR